jgi:flagellar biosynthesis protein FlhA
MTAVPQEKNAAPGISMIELLKECARGEVAVPLAVLTILMALVIPLPALLLDLLIAANIGVSVIVLLVSMFIRKPVEFSVFPSALLLLTMFRLALNVSSSRLILMGGNTGTSAAGEVIEAFGNFVVGGSFIIGVVIFLVLLAIQYVVINHGAVRISEVTARFTLDALPGKQMSVDSDLNAGLIDESQARERRKMLSQEAEFYGAMDGASRFTQRDAVAGILIVSINIIAGFLIGILQHGMDVIAAFKTYTVLTVGDGLVTVVPALMISIAGGLIVTRASSDENLEADFKKQMLEKPQPLLLSGVVLVAMAAVPGLPTLPFVAMGGGLLYGAWHLRQKQAIAAVEEPAPAAPQPQAESMEQLLRVEPLSVEVGLGLVRLAEGGANSPLLRRIGSLRRQLATELGMILPPVRVADNLSLRAREYVMRLRGMEIARFEIMQGCDLALNSTRAITQEETASLGGTPTKEPAFGMDALWIPRLRSEEARARGFTVIDENSIVGTHLGEVIRRHAHELITRQEAKKILDRVTEENPRAVEDLVPKLLSLSGVQKVLQNLLRERVSIRDASAILEATGEAAAVTRNLMLITEYVRQALKRTVVQPWVNSQGAVAAWLLDPALEKELESTIEHGENHSVLNLSPLRTKEITARIVETMPGPESPQVLLASSGCRNFLRQMLESVAPNLFVLSHVEIPAGVRIVSLGTIRMQSGARSLQGG